MLDEGIQNILAREAKRVCRRMLDFSPVGMMRLLSIYLLTEKATRWREAETGLRSRFPPCSYSTKEAAYNENIEQPYPIYFIFF